jgi:hypothetical protein
MKSALGGLSVFAHFPSAATPSAAMKWLPPTPQVMLFDRLSSYRPSKYRRFLLDFQVTDRQHVDDF